MAPIWGYETCNNGSRSIKSLDWEYHFGSDVLESYETDESVQWETIEGSKKSWWWTPKEFPNLRSEGKMWAGEGEIEGALREVGREPGKTSAVETKLWKSYKEAVAKSI